MFIHRFKHLCQCLTVLFVMGFTGIFTHALKAQIPADREKIAVLHIDTKGLSMEPAQMGDLTRIELDKLGIFEVMDRYDVTYSIEKEGLAIQNCFGKICLVEVGRKLKVDKMLTGVVEVLGENIVVTMRLIDIGKSSVEKSQVLTFLNLKSQIQPMIALTLQKMFALPVDPLMETKLTKANDYENAINVPEVAKLNLSGPRMGMTVFTGQNAQRLSAVRSEGGLDATPLMFQFGYQFETAYLNQGTVQALFEFIPIITGLDQGQFIPSLTLLHGIRSNLNGFEFAFGPSFFVTQEAEGVYYNNRWIRVEDWAAEVPDQPLPKETFLRFDRRGETVLKSSFVFAAGKSFKSGRMNIPVNVFVVPNRSGARFGISVGFNGRG